METNDFTMAAIHGLTYCNKQLIVLAGSGCCLYCGEHFGPKDIEWLEETNQEGAGNETASCPNCHIDCVIPDSIKLTKQTKRDFKAFWFN